MTDVRDYEHIDALLGDEGPQSDKIEANLADLPDYQLDLIDDGLQFLDTDSDRYREWREQLADGRYTTMHSELLLVAAFRERIDEEAVTLSKNLPGSGKDFDVVVEWGGREYWIEILKPDFADRLSEGEVGWIGWDWIPNSVQRKLESDFDAATERLPGESVRVLGVYAEEINHVRLSLSRWVDRSDFDVGEFCDAFLVYTHLSGETSVSVWEFTDAGEHVSALIDEIVDNVEE